MNQQAGLTELPPLSLYIHIPWCVRKCPYCDFNSHTTDTIPEQDYTRALIEDLDQELEGTQGRKLHSIFIGGGTPSLFSADAIANILIETEKRIPFSPSIEITLEANPGTVEQEKFEGYYTAGINRLSIGVQSFNQQHLQSLGRIHSNTEAIKAAYAAQNAGITNFNLDLMHGLPNQTQKQALEDLKQAVALSPSHISWYQLTIEPNTAFYSAPPPLPPDDSLADIQAAGEQLLNQSGFKQYEISAYSHDQQQSQHNLNYWSFGDYIGIGAGAHGKITQPGQQKIFRRWKTRNPKDYLDTGKSFTAGERILTEEDLPLEFLMNHLRLNSGFEKSLFQSRTGIDIDKIGQQISALKRQQLLSEKDNVISTTTLGRRFLNTVLEHF